MNPKSQEYVDSLQYKSGNIIQMLEKGKKFKLRLIKVITDIFLNSVLNRYLHLIINLLQYLIVFGILLQREIFNIKNIQTFNNYFITALILLILVVQCSILVMMVFLLLFQKKQTQQKVFMIEFEGYITQIVKKVVSVFLIIYRKVLGLILLQLSVWVLRSNIHWVSIEWICTIVNLSLFTGLYSLSGMNFASKIAFMPNVVSFGYKTNVETLMYGYLVIMVVMNEFSPQTTIYINLIFSILCLGTVYIRPLILYRHNTIGLVGNGLVLGLLLARSIYKIFQLQIHSPQQYIYFIASTLLLALMIVKFAHARISCVFMCKSSTSLLSKLDTMCKDQVIFYHFVNYQQQQKPIFLFLLQELQLIKQDKTTRPTQGSDKRIVDYSAVVESGIQQERLVIEKIIQSLKTSSINDPHLRKLLNEMIFLKYQTIYNPKLLMKNNLGKNQIQQQISSTKHLSMILAQILLLDQINFRRCYTFIKIHQTLLYKIDSLSFISKIEIHALIQIVQNNLKFKTNTLKQYNLKAQQYFVFEQKFQQLKKYVLKACQQKLLFWKEDLQNQPNFHKMNQVLQDNYTMHNKIKALSSEITTKFKQKGPIILFNLIASYSAKILNVKLFSTLNPFYSLVKKYKQQLVNEKKQGAFLQNSTVQKYSLLQSIGVCLVDLETEKGKILWANEDFWTEFYLKRAETTTNPYTNNRKKNYIFDLMVPQLVFRHNSYFRLFTESQKVNYQHDLSFIYQTQTKIISRVSTEIQVLPSFRHGFNVTVFLFKTPQTQTKIDKFTILVKQDLEIVGYTVGFLKQKNYFAQIQAQTNQMGIEREYLTEQLATNETFQEFLFENRNGNKKAKRQIQVCVRGSQYKAKFLKVYSLDKKAPTNIFEQNFGSFETIVSKQQHKAIQKCMYLLQFQRQRTMNTLDASYLKSLLNNFASSNNDDLAGPEIDLRSFASVMSSISTLENGPVVGNNNDGDNYYGDNKQVGSVQSDRIDKKYKRIMFSKSSKITQCWIVLTTLVGLLLVAAMASNLLIFSSREQLYQNKLSVIKYYNGLLTDICKLCIALREYNYYAHINGPYDPHIPFIINQLDAQQTQVQFRLNYLSGYINQKWSAMQILKTAAYSYYLQDAYIVVANYVLSSITYLSLVQPQEMSFPLFFTQYLDSLLSPAKINYNQATYNGIFVVAPQLANINEKFLGMVLEEITDIRTQYYVYPCVLGMIVLVVFMAVSIVVENKSETLRETALWMLARLPEKDIQHKIANLQQFKHSNCFILDDYLALKHPIETTYQSKQTIQTVTTKSDSFKNKLSLRPINNNVLSVEYNDKGSEVESQTKRDLIEKEEIYDLEGKEDEPVQSNAKREVIETNADRDDQHAPRRPKITLPQRRAQQCKLPIYFLFIAPSLGYFILILLRGFASDSHLTSSLQMASQVYNKTSNHQIVYLLTRETLYFQKFEVFKDYNWKQIVTDQINRAIKQDRRLQVMIAENSHAGRLQGMVGQLNNGNLCDNINMLNTSIYYGVTFTRQECLGVQSGLLQQGLKPTYNWFLQSAIQIINSVPQPENMTIPERYELLKMPQLQIMKTLLAYSQQFMDIMGERLEADLNDEISTYVRNVAIYSGVAIAGAVVVFILLRYRWAIVSRHRKEIISILQLLSFETIKTHKKMKEMFNHMQLNIHN